MPNINKNLSLAHWRLPPPPDKYVHNRWINLLGDPHDYHVVLLASMGMSYQVISQQTGLTKGQIAYRLQRANAHRKPGERISAHNYRNGISDASRVVIRLASKRVGQLIQPALRRDLAIDV